MQTVLLTPTFQRQAEALKLSEEELQSIVEVISSDPMSGDIIPGTGGARKLRHAGRGKGKSGGYRSIHYFGGEDVPVFLLAVYGKGSVANLMKAERNQLAAILPHLAEAYRIGSKRK